MRQAGMIGKKEIKALKLSNLNLTEAEKADWRNFREGQVIQFNQNVKGIKRGSVWSVKAVDEGKVEITDGIQESKMLPLNTGSYDVLKKTEIALSKGDQIQITRNGFDQSEKRLNNGMTLEVISVSKKEGITVRNKASKSTYNLDKDYGHLSHAHCITSYAAQGKTVDEVLIAQPSSTFSATDAKQFYVSVSRGRDSATVYTDDKDALLYHASELGDRQSAMELVSNKDMHMQYVHQLVREFEPAKAAGKSTYSKKDVSKGSLHRERDYEPEF